MSSSASLGTLDVALADEYSSQQSALLERAKAADLFLREQSPNTQSYDLLRALFSLFKSEVATGLCLRKAIFLREAHAKAMRQMHAIAGDTDLSEVLRRAGEIHAHGAFDTGSVATLEARISAERDRSAAHQRTLAEILRRQGELAMADADAAREKAARAELGREETELVRELDGLIGERNALKKQTILQPAIDDQVRRVTRKLRKITERIAVVGTENEREMAMLRKKRRVVASEINAVQQFRTDLEQELDRVHAQIDFLTNPLAIAGRDTPQSPHHMRYEVIALEGEVKRLQAAIAAVRGEIREAAAARGQAEAAAVSARDAAAAREHKFAEIQTRAKEEEELIATFSQLLEQLRNVRKELRRSDRERTKQKGIQIRLRHRLKVTREQCRELEISTASLVHSQETLAKEIEAARAMVDQGGASADHSNLFQQVLDVFRELRNELGLPLSASPRRVRQMVAIRSEAAI
jgi:hypothetical protein